jgi:cytochrome c oxidase assembly protein CtaG/Cox11
MRLNGRNIVLFAAAALLLMSLPVYLLTSEQPRAKALPVAVLLKYLKAVYARDYGQAYRFISTEDQRLKNRDVYVREHGAFSGFTLEVGRKLSEFIEARSVKTDLDHTRARIKLGLKVPDANSLAPLLLNWDEDRLNALSPAEQKKILMSLDQLKRKNRLVTVNGEEEFALVKENGAWRISLDWASGIRVNFAATVPSGKLMEAWPTIKQTVARSGDLFNISYRVKNLSPKEISAHIVHRITPNSLAPHLDLVECALILPVKLLPGEEQEYTSTYLLRGDLPDDAKELNVTYEFQVER